MPLICYFHRLIAFWKQWCQLYFGPKVATKFLITIVKNWQKLGTLILIQRLKILHFLQFCTICHQSFFQKAFEMLLLKERLLKKATTMTTSNATFSIFLAALIKDLCGSLIRQPIFFMFLALSRKVLPNFLENCKKAPPIRYWTNNIMLYKVNILHY